ncbi:hypothetical protein QFC19_002797 [Naganishia cerealis]|uniref:Uncharacterized protein n=1 Tax=Naganishia cerealis TaxID=610337 RepID=A0ACC2W676_9TREE|nr:hypothetical protein QFC19_002797 [Naganishia cerealis]
MCGISAIITPYSYAPQLDPLPDDITPPQEPEDTLKALAVQLTQEAHPHDEPAHPKRFGDEEDHLHVEYEGPSVLAPGFSNGNGVHSSSTPTPCPPAETSEYRTQLVAELKQSLSRISHRGPDGQGIWISSDARVGEIYDYEPMRAMLEKKGYVFTGTSDSELVLFLYLEHGRDFLLHLRGEFSIVLYDSANKVIIAARDRYGIKPLYWTITPSGRIFIAAEIKGFLGLSGWKPEWDVKSVVDYGWLYDTRTVFRGVKKVRAGHALVFRLDGSYELKPYWTPSYPDKRVHDPRTMEEMVAGFKERLIDAVKCRLRADVPIGIYLSGGIDSSAIAGIATHLIRSNPEISMGSERTSENAGKIKCFTIAFDTGAHDESAIAQRTAEFLGVDYRTMHASEELLCRCFERAVWAVEQPAMDLNFVGKCMLSGFVTAQGYSVVLTGEGADEICAGYSLFLADYLAEQDTTTPLAIDGDEFKRQRQRLGDLRAEPASSPNAFNQPQIEFPSKAKALAAINDTQYPQIQSAGVWDASLFAPWTRALGQGNPILTQIHDLDPDIREKMRSQWHPLHNALYFSVKGPMEGLILTSLGDRTEMSGSLESRPSFLDHHLTEYANHLPPSVKITVVGSEGTVVEKYVLREATKEFITPELYKRRKHPYSAPVTYSRGSQVHTLLTKHITRENMQMLGFVNIDYALGLVEQAFEAGGTNAFRKCLVLAEYVVLHKAFGMDTARMPEGL